MRNKPFEIALSLQFKAMQSKVEIIRPARLTPTGVVNEQVSKQQNEYITWMFNKEGVLCM